jgi:hypothetical protein
MFYVNCNVDLNDKMCVLSHSLGSPIYLYKFNNENEGGGVVKLLGQYAIFGSIMTIEIKDELK